MSTSTRFRSKAEASNGGAETRTYVREECVVFSKTDEPFGGLSNMAAGYPLMVRGVRIRTSEALYQACRFPHLPDVQRLIIGEKSPMTAKMRSKPYRDQSRADWDRVRVKIMRWALRVKLAQNFDKFAALLLDTADRPIVEFSKKDDFWGAKPSTDKRLTGANVLGRLLMELREAIRSTRRSELERVVTLEIPDFLLLGHPIGAIEPLISKPLAESDLLTMAKPGTTSAHEGAASVYEGAGQGNVAAHLSSDELHRMKEHGGLSNQHPRRLIEIDLPIRRISAHSRREKKGGRQGHISTLHIWWARRPLGACRAIICAALWPDPVDTTEEDVEIAKREGRAVLINRCPLAFRTKAKQEMLAWTSYDRQKLLSEDSRPRFDAARRDPSRFDDPLELRGALLDFIADLANWDNSGVSEYLSTARALTQAAHLALGGSAGTRSLVVDPFAGGGSIPLEALRVGADAFASDLNPIPVLLNKVLLEYVPKHGGRLATDLRKWGKWIQREAEKELAEYYPKDADGAVPIAYLWARTIKCEGPTCGAEVPLIRSLWLAKKAKRSAALKLEPDAKAKKVLFHVIVKNRDGWIDQSNTKVKVKDPTFDGTVKGGSATCPCCGYTTGVERVREQLRARRGGAQDARLMCVVTTSTNQTGRSYRPPTRTDEEIAHRAAEALTRLQLSSNATLSPVPDEPLPPRGTPGFRVQNYGVLHWADVYSPRQALTLATLSRLVRSVAAQTKKDSTDKLAAVTQALLGLSLNRLIGRVNALCWWRPQADQEKIEVAFSGQTVPMKWDFAEACPLTSGTAGWEDSYEPPARVIEDLASVCLQPGSVIQGSATSHPLPDDSVQAFITDPPYYDAVPYAALSDFFYVWAKRTMPPEFLIPFTAIVSPKDEECIVDEASQKDRAYFERCMAKAMAEGRRVLSPAGVGVIVFAHKSTAGWESQLQAIIDAGWIVTGSWPIDTEMGTRLRAKDSAALASSVHIVCRPREQLSGSAKASDVGDWRDILQELPRRIHEWMPRLSEEGVVGADAIFACLGPALEIFSRYSRVEKASGESVSLKDYLEHVWAAVAKEALAQVFKDADTTGFEPDARITAMWLWTLTSGVPAEASGEDEVDEDDEQSNSQRKSKSKGFMLEFDAARKIAQGLGATLENLSTVVEVKGDIARLLSVSERAAVLFGKDAGQAPVAVKKRKDKQLTLGLFDELMDEAHGDVVWKEKADAKPGETTLDRVHQSMILFAAGRGEAMKRFLVDGGAGQDQRFWKLAQALSALYPSSSDEKRWVDGVLARKKGFGL